MNVYTQNSVTELREMLVKSGKFTQDEADNIKGKSKLVEAVLGLEDTTEPVFEMPTELPVVKTDGSSADPTPLDVGWNEFVMGQFAKDELYNGNPKLNGLRRLTQKLVGKIVSSGPVTLNAAQDIDHPGRASVIYRVEIIDFYGNNLFFSAVGGSYLGNTNDEYGVYPECMAENRAEARALRRALQLSNVSADEVTDKNTKDIVKAAVIAKNGTDGEWKENELISEPQTIFLNKKTTALGLDLDKFLFDNGHPDIKNISRGDALKLIDILNKMEVNK